MASFFVSIMKIMVMKDFFNEENSNIEDMIYNAVKRYFDERFPNHMMSQLLEDDGYYDSGELCKLLHISLTSLWRREKEGLLTCHLIGGKKLYSKKEVQKLVESGKLAKYRRRN